MAIGFCQYFYRAALNAGQSSKAKAVCLSVCPLSVPLSVRQTHGLCQHGRKHKYM